MPYKLTEDAEKDVEDIYFEGLMKWGLLQADKYDTSLYRLFDMLAYMPTIGRKSERQKPGELRFPHGVHVVYYRQVDDGIEITRLIKGIQILDIWGDV